MPLTIGELIAGGSFTAAFIAIGGWIRSVAGRCCGFERRLKALEETMTSKSSLIDGHSINLCSGETKMQEMNTQLDSLNKGISGLQLLGERTLGQITALGKGIETSVNEVYLKLNPRLTNVEKKIENLEDDKD